jgi:formate hydrogenlyase subunit 3/multisubunit Na+/H+ antiporter MnhD subunit
VTDLAKNVVLLLALGLPLALAAAARARNGHAGNLAPVAALPALGYALLWEPGSDVDLPWLLLGAHLGLTETTRVFLLFTAFLWTVAGLYARSYLDPVIEARSFFAFFLLTMSGNLGLILARDIATFYLFFTLMSFAAYALVVHDGTERARRAGRVYLVLVLVGEALLLPAVLLAVAASGNDLGDVPAGVAISPHRDLIIALVLGGFGVKAGALPLHVWLPLAHPAAPTPASAVLSGAMIKAGLLGWLLFLPLGEAELEGWATLCVAAGLLAAFYGVLVGLTQKNPKTVLAYSSISQMGFITVGVGAALAAPQALPLALAAVSVYAAHHALAKGALFLGVGVSEGAQRRRQRVLVVAGLLLAALALAGAPLTSGAAAKAYLKTAKEPLAAPWPEVIETLFQLGAIGTTVLMGRFLLSAWPRTGEGRPSPGLWLPWVTLLAAVATLVVVLPDDIAGTLDLVLSFSALWPAAAGALIFGAGLLATRRRGGDIGPEIPEGDLLTPTVRLLGSAQRVFGVHIWPGWTKLTARVSSGIDYLRGGASPRALVDRAEGLMSFWTVAASLFALLTVTLLALIGFG